MNRGTTLNGQHLRPFRPGERRGNSDGTYSTELLRSIITSDGRAANVPTLYMGKNGPVEIPQEADDRTMEYIMRLMESQGFQMNKFNTIWDAIGAAKARSAAGGVHE